MWSVCLTLDPTTEVDSEMSEETVVVNSDQEATDLTYWTSAHTFQIVVTIL